MLTADDLCPVPSSAAVLLSKVCAGSVVGLTVLMSTIVREREKREV
jgi:hypothetical protein